MGSISSTFLWQLLRKQIPKVQKRQISHQCPFLLLGSGREKAVCKTFMKSTLSTMFQRSSAILGKKIVMHIQKDKNQISWSQLADLVNTSKLTGVRNLG
jgi:hypothetical protein